MRIAQFFNVLLGLIAVLVIIAVSNAIEKNVRAYFEVQALADLAEVRTAWSNGTVALSLERSVTQIALDIDESVPQAFRDIIDEQRQMSDAFLDETLRTLSQEFMDLNGAPSFAVDAPRLRQEIEDLRQEVDGMLATTKQQRNATRAGAIPDELKSRISRLQGLADRLRINSSAKSDDSESIEALQQLSWVIREYGGRARTYFAMATLASKPLPEGAAMAIKLDSAQALAAWEAIQDILLSTALDPELGREIRETGRVYFDEYVPLGARILAASAAAEGTDAVSYPIRFEEFFEQSSAALAGFEELVQSAGSYSTQYWNERRETATWNLGFKIFGLGSILVGLLIIKKIIDTLVIRRLEAATEALALVSSGDLDQTMDIGKYDLAEILALNNSLLDLRGRLLEARKSDQARMELQEHQQKVVDALSGGLARLAEGDLSCRIEDPFDGSYEGLRQDFNRSCEQLDSLIGDVVANARTISEQASSLSVSSQELRGQTNEQAEKAMRTVAAVETIAKSIQLTAQMTFETDTYVATAREGAEVGGEVVKQAIGAMDEIKRSSDQIAQTVRLIEDIAFQTNLLALNASVEAARAGETGRGFAVVASEVRALAQKASDAAKEIKEMISRSTVNVERGVELVDGTGEALSDIVDRVSSISDLISAISKAAGEQSKELTGVTQTVTSLESSAKQTVRTSEHSDQSCSGLNDQATDLRRLAGRFKITEGADMRSAAHQANTSRAA